MNVGELIEKLKTMPSAAKVYRLHTEWTHQGDYTQQEDLDEVTLVGEGDNAYVQLEFM